MYERATSEEIENAISDNNEVGIREEQGSAAEAEYEGTKDEGY